MTNLFILSFFHCFVDVLESFWDFELFQDFGSACWDHVLPFAGSVED